MLSYKLGFPGGAIGKQWVCSLGWEDPLEEEMATDSSILTWKIPWTEEPAGPQAMGVTKASDRTQRLNNNHKKRELGPKHTQEHVRTQQISSIYTSRREASGETSPAKIMILDFQPPKL